MRQGRARLAPAGMAAAALVLLGACDSSGVQRSFDRGELVAAIDAGAIRPPADLTGLTGTASYDGAAFASFDLQGGFTASADMSLTADFSNSTLNGQMTGWTSEFPEDWSMRGTVLVSDGNIAPNGLFEAKLSGNVQREPTARNLTRDREDGETAPTGIGLTFIGGEAAGSFHDSARGRATHVIGGFVAEGVDGFFAVERR